MTAYFVTVVCVHRWKEELEAEGTRWQEKFQKLEREKSDAVLSLKRKLASLEVAKTNELDRLKDVHRWRGGREGRGEVENHLLKGLRWGTLKGGRWRWREGWEEKGEMGGGDLGKEGK